MGLFVFVSFEKEIDDTAHRLRKSNRKESIRFINELQTPTKDSKIGHFCVVDRVANNKN